MSTAIPASSRGARSAHGEDDRPLLRRLLLASGVVAPLLFMVVVLAEGATRPNYSSLHHPISTLSLGEMGWVQTANFIVTGVLTLCFAAGLRLVLHPGRGATWVPILVAVFGIGLIGAGLFPTDPALGYPPGASTAPTLHGSVHLIVSNVGFLSLLAACFVLASRFAGLPQWRGWTPFAIVAGCLILVFAVVMSLVTSPDPEALAGLFQRLSVFSGLAFLAALGARLNWRGSM